MLLEILAISIGLGFGIFLQKGRFCFVSAFRDFFAYRDNRVLRGVIAGILTMTAGVSIAYFFGASADHFWVPKFGLSSLIGGFVFGIGMTVAGGCASGTLYRAAQGYVHYWLVLLFTILGYFVFAELFASVFLPYFFQPLQVFDGVAAFLVVPRSAAPFVSLSVVIAAAVVYRAVHRTVPRVSASAPIPKGLTPIIPSNILMASRQSSEITSSSGGFLTYLRKPWSTTRCGIGIGLLASLWFVVWSTWSVTGPEARWAGFFLANIFGAQYVSSHPYWGGVIFADHGLTISPDMLMLAALMAGALLASFWSGDFRIRKANKKRIPNVILGGLLMGFGARLAPGCNISNAFGGLAILSLSSAVATLGLVLGVYVTTHWMFREVGCAL